MTERKSTPAVTVRLGSSGTESFPCPGIPLGLYWCFPKRDDRRRDAVRAFLPKRLVFVLLGIVAFLTTLYAQRHPDWTEQAYSHVAYPVLSSIAGFLPSLVRFSVAEWVALLFVLFCLWYVVHVVRAIVKGGRAAAIRPDTAGPSCEAAGEAPHAAGEPCGAEVGAGRAASTRPYGRGVMLYRGVAGALAIACVAYAAFTALCGLNYYRLPVLVASGIRRGTVERRRAGGPVRLTCGRPGPGEGGDRGGRRSGDGRRRGLRPLRAVRRCGHRQARGTVSRARPPVLFRAQAGVGFGTDVGRGHRGDVLPVHHGVQHQRRHTTVHAALDDGARACAPVRLHARGRGELHCLSDVQAVGRPLGALQRAVPGVLALAFGALARGSAGGVRAACQPARGRAAGHRRQRPLLGPSTRGLSRTPPRP